MGVRVSARLGKTKAESSVSVSGFDLIRPNARMLREFGLPMQEYGADWPLWNACRDILGRYPDWFFATETPSGRPWNKSESDWQDYPGGFYRDIDGWLHYLPRVEKKAIRATITDIVSNPDVFATRSYSNPSRHAAGEFTVALSKEVGTENSLQTGHEWSTGISATLGIEVGGDAQGYKVSASTTVSFGYAYSRQETATSHSSHMVQDSLTARFHADAPADAEVIASLMASAGKIKLAVDYEYRPVGDGCFWFDQRPLNGKAQHRVPLRDLVARLGRPDVLRDTEIMSLGFVSDGKVVLADAGVEPAEKQVANPDIVQLVRSYWDANRALGGGNNWLQVLIAFGVETHPTLQPYTAAEAREQEEIWSGWRPVRMELERLERAQ